MDTKKLLIAVVVLLVGIFGVLAYQAGNEKPSSISSSLNEVTEEIADEIDDHTTSK